MKKSKLLVEYDYEFALFGISSAVRDYKLAWLVNKALNIRIVKVEDLEIDYYNQDKITTSHFLYETEHCKLRIVKNKSFGEEKKPLLIPELPNFDYFLLIQDESELFDIPEMLVKLRTLDLIQYIQPIEIEKLKSKENLVL